MQNVSNSFTVPAATPVELAGIATNKYGNGQPAVVAAMRPNGGPGLYTLQASISSNPDGFLVVATADDPLRQWVYWQITEQGTIGFVSAEVDLTVSPQTIVLLPPMAYKMIPELGLSWFTTQKNGTITTGPTAQAGTDVNAINYVPSTIQAGIVGSTTTSRTIMNGISTTSFFDLTTFGLVVKITAPAVLGTSTVFKARLGIDSILFAN